MIFSLTMTRTINLLAYISKNAHYDDFARFLYNCLHRINNIPSNIEPGWWLVILLVVIPFTLSIVFASITKFDINKGTICVHIVQAAWRDKWDFVFKRKPNAVDIDYNHGTLTITDRTDIKNSVTLHFISKEAAVFIQSLFGINQPDIEVKRDSKKSDD